MEFIVWKLSETPTPRLNFIVDIYSHNTSREIIEIFSDVVKHKKEVLRLNNVECVCILPFLEKKITKREGKHRTYLSRDWLVLISSISIHVDNIKNIILPWNLTRKGAFTFDTADR